MSKARIGMIALACACMAIVALPTSAQAPLKVGDIYDANITTPRNYPPSSAAQETVWVHQLTHPDATYIALHFRNFHLGQGDYLVVSDSLGNQSYVMEGRGKMNSGTFWGQHIKGDTVVLELVSTRTGGGSGFTIDEYAAGFVSLGDPPTEAVCDSSDFENAICRSPSVEYDRGRAVARLLIQGSSLCTGWLASANSHLVTNEHCISSATAALNTDYEFGAEASSCGSSNCQLCHPGQIFSGSSFIQDSPGLDYALVQLNGNPAGTYGFLEIDNRTANIGEEVYLVSHPSGRAKEFAYTTDKGSTGPTGAALVLSTTEPTCSGATLEVGYWNDTEGGSSGSPVLAVASQKVIALHHCRGNTTSCGDPNRGVPIDQICAEICGFLGPQCVVDADCDDGDSCTTDTCDAGSCSNSTIADCCGNGTCEIGEDCNNCAADCVGGTSSGAVCGNNVCEAGNGEDCLTCPSDCNGTQNGRPTNRYCCAGGGTNPVPCSDGRCSANGNTCTDVPTQAGTFCCGDNICDSGEDCSNCALDCTGVEICGDGIDNDCDGAADCDDSECSGDPIACPPPPSCTALGNSCQNDGNCCSSNCSNGPPSSRVCQ